MSPIWKKWNKSPWWSGREKFKVNVECHLANCYAPGNSSSPTHRSLLSRLVTPVVYLRWAYCFHSTASSESWSYQKQRCGKESQDSLEARFKISFKEKKKKRLEQMVIPWKTCERNYSPVTMTWDPRHTFVPRLYRRRSSAARNPNINSHLGFVSWSSLEAGGGEDRWGAAVISLNKQTRESTCNSNAGQH